MIKYMIYHECYFCQKKKKDIIPNTMDKVRIKRKEYTFKESGVKMALGFAAATLEAGKAWDSVLIPEGK